MVEEVPWCLAFELLKKQCCKWHNGNLQKVIKVGFCIARPNIIVICGIRDSFYLSFDE